MTASLPALYGALALYVLICTGLLYWTVRQGWLSGEGRGIDREALGSARYSWLILAIVVTATMLGPADALGLSEKGYTYGLIWCLAPMGAALAQLVAGLFFVHRIKEQGGSPKTLGDFFGPRFGRSSQVAVGCLIVIQAVPFAGLLTLAGAQILEVFLGLDKVYGIIGTAMVIGLYTATGGLKTIVRTDLFQGGLMLALLMIILVTTAIIGTMAIDQGLSVPTVTASFGRDYTTMALLAVAATYFFGELLLPVYAQRALMARSPTDARLGFIVAGLLAGFWYLVITAAGATSQLIGGVENPEFVLLNNVMAVASGPLASVILVVAFLSLLALTHSTFDAILNTGGTALARDVVHRFIPLTDNQQGALSRFAMVIIAALGMVIPFIWNDLIEILLVGYTLWAPTMMPVFVWILLTKPRTYPPSMFWISVLGGVAGWRLSPLLFDDVVPPVVVGVVVNTLLLLALARWHSKGRGAQQAGAAQANP